MNSIIGRITQLDHQGDLTLVTVLSHDQEWKAIVIGNPQTATYLISGQEIKLLFKETEVIIGKGENHLVSLQNQLKTQITSVEKGKILSRVSLTWKDTPIISVITTHAVDQLNLIPGERVMAMIKTNEIMLAPL